MNGHQLTSLLPITNGHIDILKSGKNIALVSDAGYPSISDPGYVLVNEVIKEKEFVYYLYNKPHKYHYDIF